MFGPWMPELAIVDLKFGFLLENCFRLVGRSASQTINENPLCVCLPTLSVPVHGLSGCRSDDETYTFAGTCTWRERHLLREEDGERCSVRGGLAHAFFRRCQNSCPARDVAFPGGFREGSRTCPEHVRNIFRTSPGN